MARRGCEGPAAFLAAPALHHVPLRAGHRRAVAGAAAAIGLLFWGPCPVLPAREHQTRRHANGRARCAASHWPAGAALERDRGRLPLPLAHLPPGPAESPSQPGRRLRLLPANFACVSPFERERCRSAPPQQHRAPLPSDGPSHHPALAADTAAKAPPHCRILHPLPQVSFWSAAPLSFPLHPRPTRRCERRREKSGSLEIEASRLPQLQALAVVHWPWPRRQAHFLRALPSHSFSR